MNTETDQKLIDLIKERDALIIERDHLNHERSSLISERDHLNHERNRFLNSTSWKLTKPLRVISSLIKGTLKPKTFIAKIRTRIQRNIESKEIKKQKINLEKYIKSGNLISIRVLHDHLKDDRS